MRKILGVVVWTLVVAAMAGCMGDPPAVGPDDGDDGPAADAAPTETTGSFKGRVVDNALDPVVRAVLTVMDGSEIVTDGETDAQGRFTFNGLAPGSYLTQVTALGFLSSAQRVTVEAGEVTEKDFRLEPIPLEDPFSDKLEFQGLMAFGADTPAVSVTTGLADENHAVSFPFNVTGATLETIIVEVYWDNPTVGLRANVWKNPNCSPCDPDVEYAEADGMGEIKIRIDRPEAGWTGLDNATEELWLFLWAQATDEQPVVAAYQQTFTAYLEAFYRAPAPEGHVILADG